MLTKSQKIKANLFGVVGLTVIPVLDAADNTFSKISKKFKESKKEMVSEYLDINWREGNSDICPDCKPTNKWTTMGMCRYHVAKHDVDFNDENPYVSMETAVKVLITEEENLARRLAREEESVAARSITLRDIRTPKDEDSTPKSMYASYPRTV